MAFFHNRIFISRFLLIVADFCRFFAEFLSISALILQVFERDLTKVTKVRQKFRKVRRKSTKISKILQKSTKKRHRNMRLEKNAIEMYPRIMICSLKKTDFAGVG